MQSLAGEHGLGLDVTGVLAGSAVRSVELVLADDELQAFVAGEQLAKLHAALPLRLPFVFNPALYPLIPLPIL